MLNLVEKLRNTVGQIVEPGLKLTLGSCFPVSETGVLLTCFHVVGDCSTGVVRHKMLTIVWPNLNISIDARVDADISAPHIDIAVLVLVSGKLPDNIAALPLDIRIFPNAPFISFGYRKAEGFDGLFSRGTIIGEVGDVSQQALIQLRSSEIGPGMSGAPLVYEHYHRVAGVISDYWRTESNHDRDLAFAIPTATVYRNVPGLATNIPGMVASPPACGNRFSKNFYLSDLSYDLEDHRKDISKTFIAATALILADQFADGSWARTLWRWSGDAFTKDIAQVEDVKKNRVKKALSVTSWAGQAIFKATGNNRLKSLLFARKYILSHWNNIDKAFGFLYTQHVGTPFITGHDIFIGNPRHTASAAKFLEMMDGLSSQVVDSVNFILRCESKERGGWGEGREDNPNSLSTAFIIDALLKISQAPSLSAFLSPDINSKLKPGVDRGIAWLAEKQEADTGMWDYENHPNLRPFYTAHVLAFAPQVAVTYQQVGERAIDSLLSLRQGGGIPTRIHGDPHLGASAMLAYGLSKIDAFKYRKEIIGLCKFVTDNFLSETYLKNYHIFDSIFVLMLCQLPFVQQEWWSSDLVAVVNAIEDSTEISNSWDQLRGRISDLLQIYDIDISSALSIISESPR
jgi:hypothetical protein